MNNNEVLRSLQHALKMSPRKLAATFALGGLEVAPEDALRLLLRERDEACVPCSNEQLLAFLDGFIVDRRGPSGRRPPRVGHVTNNMVLKKLRIGLSLYEEDLLTLFESGGQTLDKHQLTGMFRKTGHKHFKRCTDEVLQAFFRGLAAHEDQA
jgi:uncharacterized protein YehS (DUF1456 family)